MTIIILVCVLRFFLWFSYGFPFGRWAQRVNGSASHINIIVSWGNARGATCRQRAASCNDFLIHRCPASHISQCRSCNLLQEDGKVHRLFHSSMPDSRYPISVNAGVAICRRRAPRCTNLSTHRCSVIFRRGALSYSLS